MMPKRGSFLWYALLIAPSVIALFGGLWWANQQDDECARICGLDGRRGEVLRGAGNKCTCFAEDGAMYAPREEVDDD